MVHVPGIYKKASAIQLVAFVVTNNIYVYCIYAYKIYMHKLRCCKLRKDEYSMALIDTVQKIHYHRILIKELHFLDNMCIVRKGLNTLLQKTSEDFDILSSGLRARNDSITMPPCLLCLCHPWINQDTRPTVDNQFLTTLKAWGC